MDSLNILSSTTNQYTGLMSKFSDDFQQFIKDIGDAKSKTEEDRIIAREILRLKKNLKKPGVSSKVIKEGIVCMIHCEMLGHDVSFAYMEVVKFAQQQNLIEKRVAYAALSILLDEKNEIECMMNIGSIQRDLKSSNFYEICFGLIAASSLVFKDMIPAVIEAVTSLVNHKSGIVRKKAVMAMLRFYELDSELTKPYMKLFDNALLCDTDPCVLTVSLNAFTYLVKENPMAYKNLTGSLVSILVQILDRRLPGDFNHRGVPSPWLQIKILNILALLGSDNIKQSKEMYEILRQCLESTDTEQTIGCAVIYECILTIATIYPNRALVQLAVGKARLFLVAKNNNLKYLGVTVLSRLVDIDASFATDSQMDVIDCLNDPDESIKRKKSSNHWLSHSSSALNHVSMHVAFHRKRALSIVFCVKIQTLDLLYRMTSTDNVRAICDEFMKFLRSTVDDFVKSDLVTKITTLAEKYSPDNEWFIDTMNEVFELGGNLVQPTVAYNMLRIIGEGIDDDDSDDKDDGDTRDSATDDLRKNAVITYTILLDKPSLPDILVQVICWVVGEYIDLIEDYNYEDLVEKFYKLLARRFTDTSTQSWVVNALGKIISRLPEPHKHVRNIDLTLLTCDAKQRYRELQVLFKSNVNMGELFPYDASCEDIDVDLSFLDSFVNAALQRGALPYSEERKQESFNAQQNENHESVMSGLRVAEYDAPKKPTYFTNIDNDRSMTTSAPSTSLNTSSSTASNDRPNAKKKPQSVVWTKEGIIKKQHSSSSSANTESSSSDVTSQPSNESSSSVPQTHSKPVSYDDGSSESKHSNEKIQHQQHHQQYNKPDPKEILANKLFTKTTTAKTRRVPKSTKQKRPPKPGGATVESLIDMDDRDIHGESNRDTDSLTTNNDNLVDIHTTSDVNSHAKKVDDLFGGLSVNEASTNIVDLVDLPKSGLHEEDLMMGEQLSQASSDILHLPSQNQQSSLLDDDSSIEQSPPVQSGLPNAPEQPQLSSTLEQLTNTVSSTIPEEFSTFKHSNQTEICKDMNLRLMCQYVYKPTELVIILYGINQSVQTLTDVKILPKLPSNLKKSDDDTSTTFELESLEKMASFYHVISASYQSPALNMVLSGQVSYKDYTNTEKRLFFNATVSMNTLLREIEINLNDFQTKWKNKSLYEKKEVVQKPIKMTRFVEILKESNIFPVQNTGTEVLCFTSVLNNHEILIPVKLAPLHTELRVKSSSRLLNDSIIKMISNALSS